MGVGKGVRGGCDASAAHSIRPVRRRPETASPRCLPDPMPDALPLHEPPVARAAVRSLGASQIREVANAGMGDRRAAVLVRRAGRRHAGVHPRRREPRRSRAARRSTRRISASRSCARRIAALRGATARPIDAGARRRDGVGHVGADAGRRKRSSAPGDRVVAVTPLWPNLVEIPKILGAHVDTRAAAFGADGWTLDVDRLLDALTPGHARAADQFAEQSDRLDDRRATSRQRCSSIAAGTASGSSPTTSTSGCTTATTRRARRRSSTSPTPRRARGQHQQLLEGVADDRLAARLDRRAGRADGRPRQADRVQHVVLAGVRAARRRRRDRARASRRSPHTRRALARARATSWSRALRRAAGHRRRAAGGRDVRVLPRRRASSDSLDVLQARSCARRELGLAPGSAFGPEGEGFVRWCFACDTARLDDGVARLRALPRATRDAR